MIVYVDALTMDVLADLLSRARAQGAVFARSTLRAPWGLTFTDETPLSFHAVLTGELHIALEAEDQHTRLLQGDLVLVKTRGPYRFTHAPGAPAPLVVEASRAPDGPVVIDGAGPATNVICGAYTFDGSVCNTLLDALPPLVVVRNADAGPQLRAALDLLAAEVGRDAPGQQTVLDRLLDLLLVYTLRTWFRRADATPPRWYVALDDPAIGPALRAMHEDPAHPWTVAELAELASLSRAAFARRFTQQTGQAPLAYLTAWRMTLASDALLRPGTPATLAQVAHDVGYANEFAFGAAFKRHRGAPPGRWRAQRLADAA